MSAREEPTARRETGLSIGTPLGCRARRCKSPNAPWSTSSSSSALPRTGRAPRARPFELLSVLKSLNDYEAIANHHLSEACRTPVHTMLHAGWLDRRRCRGPPSSTTPWTPRRLQQRSQFSQHVPAWSPAEGRRRSSALTGRRRKGQQSFRASDLHVCRGPQGCTARSDGMPGCPVPQVFRQSALLHPRRWLARSPPWAHVEDFSPTDRHHR